MKLSIGENIRSYRKKNDLTQEALADRLGVTYQSVSRWEKGATYPDLELLPAISEIFGISVDELLGMPTIEKEKRAKETFDELRRECMKKDYDADHIVEVIRDIRRNYMNTDEAWRPWVEGNDRAFRIGTNSGEVIYKDNKMNKNSLYVSLLALAVSAGALVIATNKCGEKKEAEAPVVSETQIAAMLEKNPQMIVNALQKFEEQQREIEEKESAKLFLEHIDELNNDATTPYVGPKDAKVVLVEFFDFSCGYCKRIAPAIEKVIADTGYENYLLSDEWGEKKLARVIATWIVTSVMLSVFILDIIVVALGNKYVNEIPIAYETFDYKGGDDRIHFLNTANSDSILIESNGMFALVDAGEGDNNPRRKTEYKCIFFSNLFYDFYVSTIHGSNSKRSV